MNHRRAFHYLKQSRVVTIALYFLCTIICEAAQQPTSITSETLEKARAKLDMVEKLDIYETAWAKKFARTWDRLEQLDFDAVRLAIRDLSTNYPDQYPQGNAYLDQLKLYEEQVPELLTALGRKDETALEQVEAIFNFRREALLANPLLDFDKLLLIKRKPVGDPRLAESKTKGLGEFLGLPRQSSWQIHRIERTYGWKNEIMTLSPVHPEGELTRLYKPEVDKLVSDMDLHFDADKIMFSMPDANKLWQIYEVDAEGQGIRQISSDQQPDVHNYDACYLPDGRIAYISTAPFQGVPCNPGITVGMTYIMDANGENIRQICFEQDHNYNPTVMNDGTILYLRWEYTDIPHVWARYLFTMNPDGTEQREFYGSGSYWPNSIFYARPVPNHPSKVVGIVTGHHVGRVGELVVFDPAKGRQEADGVVQRIPGRGQKVEPVIEDRLTIDSWPKFLHPYPLSEDYFLVSCKPSPDSLWGIYLVDTYDNSVLIKEVEGHALLEPIPFRKTKKPPIIPDTVDLSREDALAYIQNVYKGPGLKDVPEGSVKELRLFTYHFAYQYLAGIAHRVGADGPWEPKRVLGTVPVEADGSAFFRIPANTPISIQPLDSAGKALQLMRSWTTAMPGEFVSCIGCHEQQSEAPSNLRTMALTKEPEEINLWRGPVRGFSFIREVQPVLDKYCVSCHDGGERDDGLEIPDLRRNQGKFIVYKNSRPEPIVIEGVEKEKLFKDYGGVFDPSYVELRKFVRVGGLESDIHLLPPGEFHTDTSELFQMLKKGHYNVKLDEEAWDRLATWIDLNAPCHGTWAETVGEARTLNDRKRRQELKELYNGMIEDPEAYPTIPVVDVTPVLPKSDAPVKYQEVSLAGWPFGTREAKRRQRTAALEITTPSNSIVKEQSRMTFDLGRGIGLSMRLVPAGKFVMGKNESLADEGPANQVTIESPFWLGEFEITNEQYRLFDPDHDSRFEHKGSWVFSEGHLGWPLNRAKQPVVRVSYQEALAFCDWLSQKIGRKVTLPSEAQWEYACRAGTDSPFAYGDLDTDFSKHANMADYTIRELAYDTDGRKTTDRVPRDARFNDGTLVTSNVGNYRPNAWGLYDMHGNVAEWTRSTYLPYPQDIHGNLNGTFDSVNKTVRGGSWYDRPKRCRSAFRLEYPIWQKVYNVGFRVTIEEEGNAQLASTRP